MTQALQQTAGSVHKPVGRPGGKPPALLGSASTADVQQYLTFLLGGEMYAVGILSVKEIIEYGSLTEIPMMPAFIRGVINLRGSVVPVIDLSARFGHAQGEVGKRTCIVIVEVRQDEAKHDLGIMVDAVSEVLEVSSADIEPAPAFGAKIRADFIDRMAKISGKFVIILDIQSVLSVGDMAALTMVADRGAEAGAAA